LIERGYVIKDYPSVRADNEKQAGRNVYIAFKRIVTAIGSPSFISLNDIYESGKLNMIRKRAKELEMTEQEYILSPHIKEVENQFNCRIIKKRILEDYKDYLV